jgi:general secretion pathway protein G
MLFGPSSEWRAKMVAAGRHAGSVNRSGLLCRARISRAFAGRACTLIVPRLAAFTLVELLLVVAIVAVLASIAVPSYSSYVDRARVVQAEGDIVQIELAVAQYLADHQVFPSTLSDLGRGTFIDPWGNPYQYLNLANIHGHGQARKDRSLVPINSDYDLYSAGKDGQSVPPLTAARSQDDVLRGRNGGFVGLAKDF